MGDMSGNPNGRRVAPASTWTFCGVTLQGDLRAGNLIGGTLMKPYSPPGTASLGFEHYRQDKSTKAALRAMMNRGTSPQSQNSGRRQ